MLARPELSAELSGDGDVGTAVANHLLCLVHPIDPRGNKVGGIETHVRVLMTHAPRDWRVLLVGIDGRGDCRLGEVQQLSVGGRVIDFLPVLHFAEDQTKAARSLLSSLTLRFTLGLLRYLPALRRAVRAAPSATIELQRFEFAMLGPLVGRPIVQVVHGEGNRTDKMDSLIKKFWFIYRMSEEIAIGLADRIVCVNPTILANLERDKPTAAKRAAFMPVAVDTKVFTGANFMLDDGVFRVVFAGRLDEFKNPPLMFKTLQRVHHRLGGKCEFHYIGTTDPERYPEFALIRDFTTLHGFRTSREVAAIMARCHAGILTSYFEGMPCYLLELLAVGRPVVAVTLPQYGLVIEQGKSGYLVDREDDNDDRLADLLCERMLETWSAIRNGTMTAADIRKHAIPYSVDVQLHQHFARHGELAALHSA
jgi:glycosyltransferase involved in cell wall biosynthesis